jgi:hypothetical protein
MRHFKSDKSDEPKATTIARSIPTRYCDQCYLSTPKANRCIHCRCLLPTTHLLVGRIETRLACAPRSEGEVFAGGG